jgi:hypothetical protein
LSPFFHAPLGARLGRQLAGLVAAFVVAAAIAFTAVRAARTYHPTWVDRMHKQAEAATAGRGGARDAGPGR